MSRSSDRPPILVLPPVLVGGVLLAGVLVHYWLWTVTPFPITISRILGFAIFVMAGILANFSHNAMVRAGTNVLPTRPSTALVQDGPYRFTRNPLYIAAMGVYIGVALWVDGLVPLLLAPVVLFGLHFGIVKREEGYLETKFGDNYRAYRAKVRRWI